MEDILKKIKSENDQKQIEPTINKKPQQNQQRIRNNPQKQEYYTKELLDKNYVKTIFGDQMNRIRSLLIRKDSKNQENNGFHLGYTKEFNNFQKTIEELYFHDLGNTGRKLAEAFFLDLGKLSGFQFQNQELGGKIIEFRKILSSSAFDDIPEKPILQQSIIYLDQLRIMGNQFSHFNNQNIHPVDCMSIICNIIQLTNVFLNLKKFAKINIPKINRPISLNPPMKTNNQVNGGVPHYLCFDTKIILNNEKKYKWKLQKYNFDNKAKIEKCYYIKNEQDDHFSSKKDEVFISNTVEDYKRWKIKEHIIDKYITLINFKGSFLAYDEERKVKISPNEDVYSRWKKIDAGNGCFYICPFKDLEPNNMKSLESIDLNTPEEQPNNNNLVIQKNKSTDQNQPQQVCHIF